MLAPGQGGGGGGEPYFLIEPGAGDIYSIRCRVTVQALQGTEEGQ